MTFVIVALFFNMQGDVVGTWTSKQSYDEQRVCISDMRLLRPHIEQIGGTIPGAAIVKADCLPAQDI